MINLDDSNGLIQKREKIYKDFEVKVDALMQEFQKRAVEIYSVAEQEELKRTRSKLQK